MYKYKDKDITSLSVNFRDLVPSSEEITQDELKLVTSDALKDNLSIEELSGIKKRFKKINYTILDMEKNRKGFGVTEDAMLTFVDHFNATKDDKDLHNFYRDHDYRKIDSMLGRIIDTRYDEKNKRVRRTALIDLRHPTSKRLDMFHNLSTTLLHGKPVCSECGSKWLTCGHANAFPRSTVAYGIEDSLVTQSAYPNAKRDSLSLFKSSLSNIDIADDFFEGYVNSLNSEQIKNIVDKDKIAAEDEKLKKEKIESERKLAEKEKELEKQKEEEEKIYKKEIQEIKKNIEFIKKVIEKDNIV